MQVFLVIAGILMASCIIYYKFYRRPYVNNPLVKKQNPYLGLRQQAISIKPEQLQLTIPNNKETAFGVVVDLGMDSGSATIVSFVSGDASLYTSAGGGIIGGGVLRKDVSAAAINFVSVAQNYFSQMSTSYNLNVPADGYIKFYILTNKAIYSSENKESEITNPDSVWTELFYAANDLLTQLRLGAEN